MIINKERNMPVIIQPGKARYWEVTYLKLPFEGAWLIERSERRRGQRMRGKSDKCAENHTTGTS